MSMDPPPSGSFPNAPPTASLVGEVLDGRYKILKKLGEGGMGEVYAAEHVHIEKRFAVKLLKAEIVSNAEAVKRFQQEARSASSIKHRNIIGVEDFGRLPDGRIYMCMELLDGQPLNDMIQQPMTADRLLNIVIQAGHGLAAAHAKGIVHRDMKPENIFVTHEGNPPVDVPKLLDFGIAKVGGGDGQNNLTRTGTIFGTPFYMAPEQALGNPVDARTDVYAMGVILYECFAGSVPFQGESFMGILTQHITTPPEPVAQRAAKASRWLPPGIAEIVGKCMEKDPAARFQTMDELVSALVGVYRAIAGAGMSSYMEAFPVGSAHHTAQPTPPPMTGPVAAQSPGLGKTVGLGTPPPFATGGVPGHAPGPSQPVMPVAGPGAMGGPGAALSASGLYDPASSSVVSVPKKGNAGVLVALVILLVAGGGITAVVMLGGKGDAGAGSGSQVASNGSGDSGGSTTTRPDMPDRRDTGTPVDAGSTTTEPGSGDRGSAATGSGAGRTDGPDGPGGPGGSGGPGGADVVTGVNGTTGPGSGAGSGEGSSGSTTSVEVKPVTVLLAANAARFEIWENGRKVTDGPANLEVVPGTPRKVTLKAAGYQDRDIVVDGSKGRLVEKLSRKAGPVVTTPTSDPKPPPPPRLDCSQRVIDARNEACRKQYCAGHPGDINCDTD